PSQRDPRVSAGPGQVISGELAHEAGCPVQDDVVFARLGHSRDATPSISGNSVLSPSTCSARKAITTWYQILVCCGASTQWFSDGKYRNRCGLLPSSPAGSAELASSSYHSR